jgi:hypothetical protein
MTDLFASPLALDGLGAGRELSREDLEELKAGLEAFAAAITPVQGPQPASVHALVVAGYIGSGYGRALDKRTEDAVADACARHFGGAAADHDGYPSKPRRDRINVVLDSGGGSLDSAFRAVLYLRRFVEEVRVYVPRRAKSAATLVAVGADRIVMSPYAELGPLDTQIKDPRNPARYVSALDCYRSVDYVREFGVHTISRALKVMLGETQAMVPLSEVIRTATDFAGGSVRPMLEQVKALDFGAWGRTLKIGETYARSLRMRLRHPDSEEVADQIARKLVYGYTHHPYPIDQVEAEEVGLKVDMMPKDAYLAGIRIADACKDEARFVGFIEDAEHLLQQLGDVRIAPQRRPAEEQAPEEAQAHVVMEPDRPPGRASVMESDRPSGAERTTDPGAG